MKIEKVTPENLNAVISLELDKSQKGMVSDNVLSMAQAAVNPSYQPRLATVNGVPVGFVMYSEWKNATWAAQAKPKEYYIFRVMVDKSQQGKGYGRAMMAALIREIESLNPKAIHIGYASNNMIAKVVYQSLGFKEHGKFEWGDVAARIDYP
ncbi:N-acetyltransferase family protein [Vibrio paucivorans]